MERKKAQEVKSEQYKSVAAKTFKIGIKQGKNGDELVINFGNFVGDNEVKVEASLSIPMDKAVKLANNIASASAFYQVKTGNDIGVPEKACKQMKELMKKEELL